MQQTIKLGQELLLQENLISGYIGPLHLLLTTHIAPFFTVQGPHCPDSSLHPHIFIRERSL